jgi:ATP synthase protein I
MGDNFKENPDRQTHFADEVAAKAARKLRSQREGKGVWFGLGMSGLIGWSVAAPTLIGALTGLWWDRRHPGAHSWTLMLLVAGLMIGCGNAWQWIARQDRAMNDKKKDEND